VQRPNYPSILKMEQTCPSETSTGFQRTTRRYIAGELFTTTDLKIEATCSSETSHDIQQATRCYISEDISFHNHPCGNLKYYVILGKRWCGRYALRSFHNHPYENIKYYIHIICRVFNVHAYQQGPDFDDLKISEK
jgi:hypothetical protein